MEIQSEWTGHKREQMGIVSRVKLRQLVQTLPTLSAKGRRGGWGTPGLRLTWTVEFSKGKGGPPATGVSHDVKELGWRVHASPAVPEDFLAIPVKLIHQRCG